MRGLKGKVAIVAGAAPGNIGGATAVRLAEEGSAVMAADLNEAAAYSVVDEIRTFGFPWRQARRALQLPGARRDPDRSGPQSNHREVAQRDTCLGAVTSTWSARGHRCDGGVPVLRRRRLRQRPDDPRRRRRQLHLSAPSSATSGA